jgi:hypothetical protein
MNGKFQVNHVQLSKVDENEAKRLAKKTFPYLIEMSGDLERFLGSHGLLSKKKKIVKDSQWRFSTEKKILVCAFLLNYQIWY